MPIKKTCRLIIGISGASGAIYGIRLLQALRETHVETHLVVSRSAGLTIAQETSMTVSEVTALADFHYNAADLSASISSGSFRTIGMIIAPCSMRSLGEIASGVTSTLLTRAADVVLKERRRLVLMARESPLHLGHLKTMVRVTETGAIIAPPLPAFYNNPQSINDLVNHSVGRALDLYDLDVGLVHRWKDGPAKNAPVL